MKRIKLFILAASVIATASAFNTKNNLTCADGNNVFYRTQTGVYYPFGTPGFCDGTTNVTCKYYNAGTPQNPNYIPCPDEIGYFVPDAGK
jgi:hypothetical protein